MTAPPGPHDPPDAPTDPDGTPPAASMSVARQSGITGVIALAGVLSGLVFDLTWLGRTGDTDATDAMALALRLPFAAVAVSVVLGGQVLVPTFGMWLRRLPPEEQRTATAGLLAWAAAGAAGIATVLTLAAGPVMRALSPDWSPAKIEHAATLTRVLVWYLPGVLIAEVFRSWLGARLVVGIPAVMSLLMSLTGIVVVVLGPQRVETVPLAYVAGSLVQVAAMALIAVRHGWRPARPAPWSPPVRRTLSLFARPTAAAGLNPLMRAVEGIVVSFLPTGSATYVHFGNRVASAMGGTIVFRSVMVSVVPRMTRAIHGGDAAAVAAVTRTGLRLMFYLAVPMTVLGVVVGPPLTEYVYGFVRSGDPAVMGAMIGTYALSLAGSGIQRALLAPFYARRDTRTPLRNTIYGILANAAVLGVGFPLVRDSRHAILLFPVAYATAQYVNVAHALWRVHSLPGLGSLRIGRAAAGSLACGLLGGAAAWLVLTAGAAWPAPAAPVLAGLAGVGVSAAIGRAAGGPGSRSPAAVTENDGRRQQPSRRNTQVQRAPRSRAAGADWRPRPDLGRASAGTAVLGLAVTAYTVLALFGGASRLVVAVPIAALVSITLVFVALNDLETFVLVALAVRSSLDAVRIGHHFTDPSVILGLLLLGLGTLWLLNRRVKLGSAFPTSRLGMAFMAFVVVAAVGIVLSPDPGNALIEWSRIANIAVVFLVVEQFAARGAGLARFAVAIGAAVTVPALVSIGQLVTGSGLYLAGGFSRITGTFVHSNPLAYFAVVAWLLMASLYPVVRGLARTAVVAVFLVASGLILLSFTRSAWLVAVIGLLILLYRRRAYLALAIGCALVLLGGISSPVQSRFADLDTASAVTGKPANSLSWRVDYWQQSLSLAKPSPIAGVGLRTVSKTTTAAKQPHNDVVRAYVELGIPGLVSYLVLLVLMVWHALAAALDAGRRRLGGIERAVTEAALVVAVAVVVLSMVANLMSQVVVMLYAVTVLGLSSGAYLRRLRRDAAAAPAVVPTGHLTEPAGRA